MDNKSRLEYLQAIGIDVWVSRSGKSTLPAIRTGVVGQDGDDRMGFPEQEGTVQSPENQAELSDGESCPDSWSVLQKEVAGCIKCSLSDTRTHTVFGSGDKNADWMLIGEAPGQSEDQEGKPFVGKAGLLLTEMLRAIGLNREQVFITNILKCRPPQNRDPQGDEVLACDGYLQRQVAGVNPRIILAIGRVAAQKLLKTDLPIGKLRGTIHHLGKTPVVVMYHPAYLLRSLTEKRKAWADLKMAMKVFRDLAL